MSNETSEAAYTAMFKKELEEALRCTDGCNSYRLAIFLKRWAIWRDKPNEGVNYD